MGLRFIHNRLNKIDLRLVNINSKLVLCLIDIKDLNLALYLIFKVVGSIDYFKIDSIHDIIAKFS